MTESKKGCIPLKFMIYAGPGEWWNQDEGWVKDAQKGSKYTGKQRGKLGRSFARERGGHWVIAPRALPVDAVAAV